MALKAAVAETKQVGFKLQSFVITMVSGHGTNIYCSNQSVVHNKALVES